MRKRAEAPSAPQTPDPRQQTIPGTQSPPVLTTRSAPDHVHVDNGIVFIRCPDCGLVQSSDTAKPKQMPNGHVLLHCVRCVALLDPDEELTPDKIAVLKAGKNTPAHSNGAQAPTRPASAPAPAQPSPPPPPPAKPVEPAIGATTVICPHPVGTGICGKPIVSGQMGHLHREEPRSVTPGPVSSAFQSAVISMETFALTWGEEVFRTGEFSTFRVGPFTRTSMVHEGETLETAKQRVYEDLRGFAMREFDRKAEDHLNNIDRLANKMSDRATSRRAAVA